MVSTPFLDLTGEMLSGHTMGALSSTFGSPWDVHRSFSFLTNAASSPDSSSMLSCANRGSSRDASSACSCKNTQGECQSFELPKRTCAETCKSDRPRGQHGGWGQLSIHTRGLTVPVSTSALSTTEAMVTPSCSTHKIGERLRTTQSAVRRFVVRSSASVTSVHVRGWRVPTRSG